MITDDDDAPQLSAETLKILQEWQREQQESETANQPQEDWVCYLIRSIQQLIIYI